MLAPTLPSIDSTQAPRRPGWSSLLPREHGGWALVGEPLVLALLAAPSWRGGLLALAAVALFLMRRPYLVLATERGGVRRGLAVRVLAVLGGAGLVCAVAALGAGSRIALAPLAAAAVAAGVFLWFDRQREARAVLAECAGAATYAALAVAIVLLAGGRHAWMPAIAVGGFAAARGWTSILPVRVYVRRRKGQPASGAAAIGVASVLAVAAVAAAPRLGTWVPAAWLLVFAARTLWLVGPWAPSWPARRIGWMEAALGLAACVSTGISLS